MPNGNCLLWSDFHCNGDTLAWTWCPSSLSEQDDWKNLKNESHLLLICMKLDQAGSRLIERHLRRAKGLDLALAVGLLHVAAFALGYFLCKGLNFDEKTARTVSIETGGLFMQSWRHGLSTWGYESEDSWLISTSATFGRKSWLWTHGLVFEVDVKVMLLLRLET